jgi:hypothetical protein
MTSTTRKQDRHENDGLSRLRRQRADLVDEAPYGPAPELWEKVRQLANVSGWTQRGRDPNPDVQEAFEEYLNAARKEVGWLDLQPNGPLAESPDAWKAFQQLVAGGAQPYTLSDLLEEWAADERRRSKPGPQLLTPAQMRKIEKRLKAAANDLERVYAFMRYYWRVAFKPGPSQLLRDEATMLLEAAGVIKRQKRPASDAAAEAILHVLERTGRAHYPELARIITALRPHAIVMPVKALQKRFARIRHSTSQERPKMPRSVRDRTFMGGLFTTPRHHTGVF